MFVGYMAVNLKCNDVIIKDNIITSNNNDYLHIVENLKDVITAPLSTILYNRDTAYICSIKYISLRRQRKVELVEFIPIIEFDKYIIANKEEFMSNIINIINNSIDKPFLRVSEKRYLVYLFSLGLYRESILDYINKCNNTNDISRIIINILNSEELLSNG